MYFIISNFSLKIKWFKWISQFDIYNNINLTYSFKLFIKLPLTLTFVVYIDNQEKSQ
jgi:hypothetical protein